VLLLSFLGGCHLVYRYEDREADSAVVDAAPVDLKADRKKPPPDAAKPKADTKPKADAKPKVDAKVNVDAKVKVDVKVKVDAKVITDKAFVLDAGCGAATTVNPAAKTCKKQCLSTKHDLDCDGLPNNSTSTAKVDRDPWSTSCNRLLLNEDFAAAPIGSGAVWSTSGFNPANWACGKLTIDDATLTLKKTAALTTPKFLVEAKVTLGVFSSSSKWSVLIRTTRDKGASRYDCGIWKDPSPAKAPGLRLVSKCQGFSIPETKIPGKAGETYFIQSYWTGTNQVCRILDKNGKQIIQRTTAACTKDPQLARALAISAVDRALTLHHVRVFKVP